MRAGIRHRLVLRGDGGSLIPLIAVFVLVVVLMLMGMTASTSAFIAQRDLQGVCDETAAAAASEVNLVRPVTGDPGGSDVLSLDPKAVAAAVEAYRVRFFAVNDPGLSLKGSASGGKAVVRCHRKVKVPFGTVFGKGDGVDRDAVSAIRSPVTKPTAEVSIVPE